MTFHQNEMDPESYGASSLPPPPTPFQQAAELASLPAAQHTVRSAFRDGLPAPPKPLNLQAEEEILTTHRTTVEEINHLKQQMQEALTRGDHQAASILQQEYLNKEQPLYQEITSRLPKDDAGLRRMFKENAEYYRQVGNMDLHEGYHQAAKRLTRKMYRDRRTAPLKLRNDPVSIRPRSMNGNHQHQSPAFGTSTLLDPAMFENHQQQGLGYAAPSFSFHSMVGNTNSQAGGCAASLTACQIPGYMTSSAAYQAPSSFASAAPYQLPYFMAHPQQYCGPSAFLPSQDNYYTDFTSPSILLRDDVHNGLRFVNFTAVDFKTEHHHSFYNREPLKYHDPIFTDRELNSFVMRVDDMNDEDTTEGVDGYFGTPNEGETVNEDDGDDGLGFDVYTLGGNDGHVGQGNEDFLHEPRGSGLGFGSDA